MARRLEVTGNFDVLDEFQMMEGQRLKIVKGDLSDLGVGAVVHPTSANMAPSGQVGSSLSKVGGPSFKSGIDSLVKSRGNLSMSQAAISSGGSLPASYVIHVYSPVYSNPNSLNDLGEAVVNCLEEAASNNVETLAFPSIGSGGNNFPKVEAARKILRTIKDYFRTKVTSVEEIYFVLYDQESLGIYQTELGRLKMHGDDDD